VVDALLKMKYQGVVLYYDYFFMYAGDNSVA